MKNPFPILIAIAALALSQLMCVGAPDSPEVDFKGTVTITTFADTNLNGVQDAGEQGVPNVSVQIVEATGIGKPFSSSNVTRANGQVLSADNYAVGLASHCPVVTITITAPEGMMITSGSNTIDVQDWECQKGAPNEQGRSVFFGLAPAAPTATPTAAFTATPSATPDPSSNAEVIFEKGNTTDLVDCSGTEFAFTVKDPEGVKQVYIEFAVAGFDTDFSTIAGTLDLTNSGGDTWSGTLNDTFSTQGKVTYWRVVVVDNNGIQTVYHEDGKFSFYARDKSCK